MRVIFSTLQEQLSSLNVKENNCYAALVGTLSRVLATRKQMQYVLICVYVKFSKRECQL